MLVHSSWDVSSCAPSRAETVADPFGLQIEHGWRTAKRPGADYFLAYLSQFYEIVLFTTQPAYVGHSPP